MHFNLLKVQEDKIVVWVGKDQCWAQARKAFQKLVADCTLIIKYTNL